MDLTRKWHALVQTSANIHVLAFLQSLRFDQHKPSYVPIQTQHNTLLWHYTNSTKPCLQKTNSSSYSFHFFFFNDFFFKSEYIFFQLKLF